MEMTTLLLTLVAAVAYCSGESVVVNVSEHGADSELCLQGKSNCSNLGYALKSLKEFRSNVAINVFYSHQLNDTSSLKFYQVNNIAILGHPQEDDRITVSCLNLGMGLYFNSSTNITIRHMTWANCGVRHPTTANAKNWANCTNHNDTCFKNLVSPKAVSTLFVFNCRDLVLDHTHFSSNRGSGISLYNVHGQVDITNSNFTNHTLDGINSCSNISETTPPNSPCSPQATGLYIEMMYCTQFSSQDGEVCPTGAIYTEPAQYYIINCTFQGNNNSGAYRNITDVPTNMEQSDISHWPFGRGGGMGVVLKAVNVESFTLKIYNNTFDGNTAVYGGGMYFLLRSRSADSNRHIWRYNSFSNNSAVYNGGGLYIEISVIYGILSYFFKNYLHLGCTNFTRNMAYWGGGVAFTTYPSNMTYVDLELVQCDFTDNKYSGGGGAIALLLKEMPEKQSLFIIAKVSFKSCTFSRTIPVLADSYSQQIMSSTVHSEGIKLSFCDVTVFGNNSASALHLSDTGAVFYDNVTFYNNTGYDGGGVSLSGKSWITLTSGVSVRFIGNRAYRYGGAIYYDPSPVLNMNMTSSCFVSYKPENVSAQNWWVNVSFTNNTASLAGDAAFVTDPRQCVWFNQPSLFDSNKTEIFNYSGQMEKKAHVVSTPSRHLSFNCSSHKFMPATTHRHNDLHRYAQYSLMPGEALNITLVTYDSIHQVIQSSLISVSCYRKKDYESYNHQDDACGEGKPYHIDDSNRQVLSGSVLNNFKVYGPNSNGSTPNNDTDDLVLVFKTVDPIPVILPLLIKFRPCSNGFWYDPDNKVCVCLQNPNADLSPVVCVNGMLPCVKHGYWYGKLNDNFVYHFCHNDRCRGSHVDSCEGYHGYIQLPTNDSLLCANGLQGPLCTRCNDNHSLSYNSYECVECSAGRTVGLILLMLLECFVIVVVILGFLKLNMRVSTAWFYGFLYFYSVLRLLIWIPLPTGLDVTIGIIVGVTSLDFQLLQYSGMCVSEFRAIHYEALHYLYPIAVMVMILMIIKLDRVRCIRSQFFTGESSVQALCIILLIIYTSISETSLNMLLPLSYGTTNNNTVDWYVKVDPGLPYMDTHNHLPFWLLAMSVELLLVLPFSLLMFVAPWAMRYINLSKIKPILDEYHNCFHDNCRWFAGVYLLARQLMFLLPIIGQGPELAIYLQQIFCLVLLLLVATLQPYRQKSLYIIDVLLLSLLTFLSFTSSSVNGRRVYDGSLDIQVAVVGVAVITPCIGLVIGMIVGGVNKLCFRTCVVKHLFKLPMNSVLNIKKRTVRCTTREDDLPPRFYDEERNHDERTPLLLPTQGGSGNRALLASNPTAPLSHAYSIND